MINHAAFKLCRVKRNLKGKLNSGFLDLKKS